MILCLIYFQNGTPRFRAINFDAITLDTPLSQTCPSGVLSDMEGRVQGLWLSFLGERSNNGQDRSYHLGIHIEVVLPVLDKIRSGQIPKLKGLAIELTPNPISYSRQMGVSDEWVQKIAEANPRRRQLFVVHHVECGTPTASVLKDLDIILSLNGKVVSRITDFELGQDWADEVDVVIVRNKIEMSLKVPTSLLDGECTTKVISFAGAIIHGKKL